MVPDGFQMGPRAPTTLPRRPHAAPIDPEEPPRGFPTGPKKFKFANSCKKPYIIKEIARSLPMGLRGLWMAPHTPGTAPRGDPDAPQDASPNDPRSQHPFQNYGQPYMFEAHEFELPMNFEGLWMVSKTPGTAARGAPNAPKDCQRDHGPREASTHVCNDVWYYICVCVCVCVYAHGKRQHLDRERA